MWSIIQWHLTSFSPLLLTTFSESSDTAPALLQTIGGAPSVVTPSIDARFTLCALRLRHTASQISTPFVVSFMLSILSSSSPLSEFSVTVQMKRSICAMLDISVLSSSAMEKLPLLAPPHVFPVVLSDHWSSCDCHSINLCHRTLFFSATFNMQFRTNSQLALLSYFLSYHIASLCYSFTGFRQICENWLLWSVASLSVSSLLVHSLPLTLFCYHNGVFMLKSLRIVISCPQIRQMALSNLWGFTK